MPIGQTKLPKFTEEMPAGYTPLVEEGINFYTPEWHNKITEVFTNCVKNGISYDEDMEIFTADGKRVIK